MVYASMICNHSERAPIGSSLGVAGHPGDMPFAERAVLFFAQNLAELAAELVAGVGLGDQIDATPELPAV